MTKRYGQFCPVAKTAEILGERWTLLIIRELVCGGERFNEIRRGMPLISPTLLAQRLRGLEDAGLVHREPAPDGRGWAYRLTEAGRELRPLVELAGHWGQRYLGHRIDAQDLDAGVLMWDMRRRLQVERFPMSWAVLQFDYPDAPRKMRHWWLLVEGTEVDLCMENPGFEPDLYVVCELRIMIEVWMGKLSVARAIRNDALKLHGSRILIRSIGTWLGLSMFANGLSSGGQPGPVSRR